MNKSAKTIALLGALFFSWVIGGLFLITIKELLSDPFNTMQFIINIVALPTAIGAVMLLIVWIITDMIKK